MKFKCGLKLRRRFKCGLKLRRRFKLNLARKGHHKAQRNVVLIKKIFLIEVNVAHQNHASHKKICCGKKKKNMWHPIEDSYWLNMFSVAQKRNTYLQRMVPVVWSFIKRQTRGTSSANEWKRVTTSGTTSDNEWQRVVQRMPTSGTTSSNEWQRVRANDSEWQQNDKKWYK